MKKLLCIVVCLFLILPSALADASPVKLTKDDPLYTSLYERSMELAGLFNEALHSETYLQMYVNDLSTFEDVLAPLRMQDFTKPVDVTIVCAEDALAGLSAMLPAQSGLSPALGEIVRQRVYGSAASVLAAQSGPSAGALASILAFSDAYIRPEEMTAPCFVVMQYGGLYAFLVTFYPTVNGTVAVNARFIPSRAADSLNLPIE